MGIIDFAWSTPVPVRFYKMIACGYRGMSNRNTSGSTHSIHSIPKHIPKGFACAKWSWANEKDIRWYNRTEAKPSKSLGEIYGFYHERRLKKYSVWIYIPVHVYRCIYIYTYSIENHRDICMCVCRYCTSRIYLGDTWRYDVRLLWDMVHTLD